MKRTIIFAALSAGLLIVSAGGRHRTAEISAGRQAPYFRLAEDGDTLSLDDFRGKFVILNFWSATDGPSRGAFTTFTAWRNRHPEADVGLIGINFDRSEGLYREIVRNDRVDTAHSFNVRGDKALALIDAYGLDKGYRSVLISPDGKIAAINPSEKTLDRLVTQGRHRSTASPLASPATPAFRQTADADSL